ncbi:3-isopropylmalate dehydratase small subunit [Marinobacter oulmenensis]|uniref:3-isopropylmalate dehydratase n=1 Tax=Marinobacter oulmenensis TaxID=643747 RepID=A0A840U9P9_9GAMM|nr:3-isopropylmalate dehydratase small subunit [Marinobacter oulmenensis]MBB5320933.1 3-isopropylmalate/(R)-2-methylmalate dehydratase small subunit [Marinobacter oulmenensis]
MEPMNQFSAVALPLPLENVDTDQLIPARFMKEPRKPNGYGAFLLHDMRFDSSGEPLDFMLNRPEAASSEVLVARRNFGAGSSREAAVYALVDHGFRCVIAPSFGDIFASNSVNNGLLPALVSEQDCERLLEAMAEQPATITIDLQNQCISLGEQTVSFDINPTWKLKLLNGWDDIDLTLARTPEIEQFRTNYKNRYPWLG